MLLRAAPVRRGIRIWRFGAGSCPWSAAVARRSAYLLLLIENPPALADLVRLCGASPWIAEQLAGRPALLDELLDRASLYTAPERETLQDEAAPAAGAPGDG
jgi:glutamine synthetase adenylyltransferase